MGFVPPFFVAAKQAGRAAQSMAADPRSLYRESASRPIQGATRGASCATLRSTLLPLVPHVLAQVAVTIGNRNRAGPIAEEVRAGLFEPFKGTASLSEAASRSAGLGLYIVQQIVQAHDGEIRVHSDAPMTQFTIVLKCEGGEPQTT